MYVYSTVLNPCLYATSQHLAHVPQCLRIVCQGGKISQLLVSIGLYNAIMMNLLIKNSYKRMHLTNKVNFKICFSKTYKHMRLITNHGLWYLLREISTINSSKVLQPLQPSSSNDVCQRNYHGSNHYFKVVRTIFKYYSI